MHGAFTITVWCLLTFLAPTSGLVVNFNKSLKTTNALLRSALNAVSSSALKKLDFNLRLQDESLLRSVASALKVASPFNAPKAIWSLAWRVQCFFLPILHFFDSCVTRDTCLNLAVLWWKAIAGDKVAYDLLPSFTRNVVGWPLRFLYPRLHHQNVLLRTRYLDKMLKEEIDAATRNSNGDDKIAIVCLGAGFDTRSIRFMNGVGDDSMVRYSGIKDQIDYYELDLPDVIDQKLGLLERYQRRRKGAVLPTLLKADLNDLDMVRSALHGPIFSEDSVDKLVRYKRIIIIVEAVLMYLDKEKVSPLLKSVIDSSKKHSGSVSFVFSDRFPGIYEKVDKVNADSDDILESNMRDRDLSKLESSCVADFLHSIDNRLDLVDWLPKPGRARHQGVARVVSRREKLLDEDYPRLTF